MTVKSEMKMGLLEKITMADKKYFGSVARRLLLAALVAAPLPALADCISIGPKAEFCADPDWTFQRYVKEGVLHVAADGTTFYHLHRLRSVARQDQDDQIIFEEQVATFALEYGGDSYENVTFNEGERFGGRSLEYEFSVKEWGEGNRSRMTFLISNGMGYSLVTSGQPPVDRDGLLARHEAAVAAFQLKAAE